MNTKRKQLKGNVLLILAAFIWGIAFVAQDKAAESLETFTINGIRFIIGTAVLLPVILIRRKRKEVNKPSVLERRLLIKAGIM